VKKQTGDIRETPDAPSTPDAPDVPETADGGKRRLRPSTWVNGPSRAIALAVLLVLVVLFGRDVLSSLQLRSEIGDLERRKKGLLDSLAADSVLLRRLDDPEFLEKYARENYLMRKEGEVVYIIDE
jgi:cell division protein FtsB